jgi:type IV pilus assembly protein PilX
MPISSSIKRGLVLKQTGLVLLIALIVLVVMSLGSIALVRSMIATNQLANNLALRQGTTAAADVALEKARYWLVATSIRQPRTLDQESRANGYSPINIDTPVEGNHWADDVAWVWANPSSGNTALAQSTGIAKTSNANGYSVAYFIQRNCKTAGRKTPNDSACDLQKMSPSAQESKSIYQMTYQITVRVQGPKDTVSFYQSTLY